MKTTIYILALLPALWFSANAQDTQKTFTRIVDIPHTEVKDQQRTGTCWAFATASFFESEILRLKKYNVDLSEMYAVRCIYEEKARNYFLRQGKANFSQGGLAHDFVNAMYYYGLATQKAYPGKPKGEKKYNHTELAKILEAYVKAATSSKLHTSYWMDGYKAVLDVYLGEKPAKFTFQNKEFSPKDFPAALGLNAKDYIEITSFSHHPYYKFFVLEIPDNFSSGMYYNLPVDQFKRQIDYALDKGFSICWDGDVSESGFGRMSGIIELDKESEKEVLHDYKLKNFENIKTLRQDQFEKIKTTDDHLMHIVGKAQDQNGNIYYIIKNSWGEAGRYKGYFYMSEPYLLLKTVSIMIHKDAMLENIVPEVYLPAGIY